MGLFDRVSRVVRANLNDLVSKAEDPEKVLEQAVVDMQDNLVELRKAVARTIAEQKRTEKQFSQNQTEADKWQQRAQLALQKGDENLAREALVRKKGAAETAQVLKNQLDNQTQQVQTLKKQLVNLESKISEAKTKKNMLKARAQAANANRQLQSTVNNISTDGAMSAFERMEDKVVSLEAESQAAHELEGGGLEDQFKQLEGGSDVDDELLALKAEVSGQALPGTAETQPALPEGESETPSEAKTEVDDELEALRNQLRNS